MRMMGSVLLARMMYQLSGRSTRRPSVSLRGGVVPAGEGEFDAVDDLFGRPLGALELRLDEGVAGDAGDELAQRLAGLGEVVEDHRDADQAVPHRNDSGLDDAAAALAAENRAGGLHGRHHVCLAGRAANDGNAGLGGDVVDHPAGAEVRGEGAFAVLQHPGRTEGEGVFLADVGAVLVDEGEAVGIRVLGEADDGLVLLHGVAEGR